MARKGRPITPPQSRGGASSAILEPPDSNAAAESESPSDIPLFRPPDRDSVWSKVIFKPMYDPFDVVQSQFMVRTKAATIVPFKPFRTQKQYVARMGLRNVVVKPRQVGSSTVNLGLMTANALTCPNVNSMIITHLDETTAAMRTTIQNFIGWLNEYHNWGIEIGKDNENQLEIKNTGSWFFFGTAGGSGVGRSRTVQQLLVSELAHWNVPNPGAELGGMVESVPETGLIVAESTPNGAAGPFYELYNNDSGWVPHFFPWFLEPSRSLKLPDGYQLTLTDEEQGLRMAYQLSHAQIAWRRKKIAEMSAQGLDFLQEYPEDDITCFTAGIKAYFPAARMNVYLRQALASMPQVERWPGDSEIDPGGELRTYYQPKDGWHYIVYGDVGGGHRDGDMSVAVVRCYETGQIVAVLAGWWKPSNFSDLTIRLAEMYGGALLCHEANGLGQGAVDHAAYVRKYPNYYWEKRAAQTSAYDQSRAGVLDEWKPGFYVTTNQRTVLFNGILQEVVDGTFKCQDKDAVRQLTAARLNRKRSGGTFRDVVEMPDSVHDDYAMALAGATALAQNVVIVNNRPRPVQAV
ncbi:MAG: hypothetical protein ACSLE3_06790 [Microbacteriaceae bacterium]